MFNVSKIIRKLIIDRDENVTNISRKIGVSQQNLSRKLNNNAESYTLDYLYKVVKAMNCDISVNIIDSDTQQILYTISDIDKQ